MLKRLGCVLLIAAIAEWAHHPAPTPIEDEAKP